ncbi:hypothetical protein WN944_003746 [Citrus x changshan-huyou]|uniref:RNA helicase n=1 Tax=Citrus x changshan-huyou TaxID=2935761 RepID=A0AAP0QH70_9ROSI
MVLNIPVKLKLRWDIIDPVVKACFNPSRVRSLFSATLPDFVDELARSIMHGAVRVIVGRKNTASESIKQKLVFAGSEGKLLALRQSFAESLNPPVLIFVQSKERAKELYGELAFDDIRAGVIHSDLSQTQSTFLTAERLPDNITRKRLPCCASILMNFVTHVNES